MSMALAVALAAGAVALAGGLAAPLLARAPRRGRAVLTATTALAALLALVGGAGGLLGGGGAVELPIGLPWMPMGLRLDALGGFFLLVIGALGLPVALYGHGYLRHESQLAALAFFLPLFLFGMIGVVLADDAFTFMLFWELMSLASYFLVVHEHRQPENRKAGFVYLLMAHLAGLLIMGAFAVLYAAAGSFRFHAMHDAALSPLWASLAFLLAALGFGTKAGVVPMHGWLPDAHPVAPSNVSALMSGVMLKVAIFGFIRLVWDLIGPDAFQWWWGTLVLAAGSGSAVGGVLMALQQHDLKRLLAYHSIENVGIILIGLGLGMLLSQAGHTTLAALGLIAALYHTINHALFKGLLFMGAGAVLHAGGGRDMEAMGGLIHRMPWTALFFLVACISISALPPFNGFVSEWLTFQTALMAPQLHGALLTAMVPFSASMLALAGALAAACFVKVFGVVFLGHARSPEVAQAREVDGWMRLGMALPALSCLLLGLLPALVVPLIDRVPQALLDASLTAVSGGGHWLWLVPVARAQVSYSAPIALLGMVVLGGLVFWRLHPAGSAVRRAPLWSCGNPHVHARMQYSATSFSQPLRRIFAGFYRPQEHEHAERARHELLTTRVRYVVHVGDRAVQQLYRPLADGVLWLAARVRHEHQRGLHAYLAYTFATVLFLLAVFV
ncbi:MAG: hydrogenase 4 subunit B [Zetaproteobacteria bacterium]|nr:MAG: hydrogenase 4 subunit B [Zetaproteobacteria bacterium]